MSYEVQIRRAAELDVAEAQLWYETQRSGLGAEFHSEVSQVIDRLAETPLIYQVVYKDQQTREMYSVKRTAEWYRTPSGSEGMLPLKLSL